MRQTDIFDRSARRRTRERMSRYPAEDRWILQRMADDLLARLEAVRRPFRRALILGFDFEMLRSTLESRGIVSIVADASTHLAAAAKGVACDEDRLAFADKSFDLVLAMNTLDTVTDLPGALILIQRILEDGGLFLGTIMGAGSLPTLRSILHDQTGRNRIAPRFHPQIDVRGAGDLLARAQLQLPVAESETFSARYRSLDRLINDLRANGLTNVLCGRAALQRASLAFATARFETPVVESFAVITLTGWAKAVK